jgi:hypothetical protein
VIDANPPELELMPPLVIGLAILSIAAGVLWYCVTVQVIECFWSNQRDRPNGSMSFRYILQASVAAIAAIHGGIRDAWAGRAPYFWTAACNPPERLERLREGLAATARIILLGFAMDMIYQHLVFKTFYPVEALLIPAPAGFCAVPAALRSGRAYRALGARRCVG